MSSKFKKYHQYNKINPELQNIKLTAGDVNENKLFKLAMVIIECRQKADPVCGQTNQNSLWKISMLDVTITKLTIHAIFIGENEKAIAKQV